MDTTVRIPVGDGFEELLFEPDDYDELMAGALMHDCTIEELLITTMRAWWAAGKPDPTKPWG
jgi:hypothetical protein